ncbi:MAG TPA: hypothetical protein VNO43_09710 [Candidatus Eisenbacteria bacterium]|nr:hypothetical protein [Candidatus Eisenbacteria bacterium]
MGLDFIRKAAASFRKGLDRRRIELATPTLFTHEPDCAPRTYAATMRNGHGLAVGETVGVRLVEQSVIAFRGLDPVAIFDNPPAELIDALTTSVGEAWGVVQQVHDTAQVAEIAVC